MDVTCVHTKLSAFIEDEAERYEPQNMRVKGTIYTAAINEEKILKKKEVRIYKSKLTVRERIFCFYGFKCGKPVPSVSITIKDTD